MTRSARVLGAGAAGFVLGAVLTLALQGQGLSGGAPVLDRTTPRGPTAVPTPPTVSERATTFLAWTPGGLPAGFEASARSLPKVGRVVVVRSDVGWLSRSFSLQGNLVDLPRRGFRIPLEVAAVDPRRYAPFLPPPDRGLMVALARGKGILGASSARLRGLGPGSVLEFAPGARVEIAAVLPDELLGANEVLVSRTVGTRIGVVHDRYALLQLGGTPGSGALESRLARSLGPGVRVQVRAPGETPFFRQGDAVLPPVALKELFGEFAARPRPDGTLVLDPAWVRTHIQSRRVPLIGLMTCNRALFPQIVGAMRELRSRGLGNLVRTYHGCYVPRRILSVPTAAISHHTWGVGFDINIVGNGFGERPHQDGRLVRILERWGFIWGGRFIVPDGNHFEYHRPPASG